MKLLVVSHPCVTPINQQLYAEVQRQSGWNLTILGPTNWIDDYGARRKLEKWSGFDGNIEAVPVWLSGNIPLHVYRTTFTRLLRRLQPDVIYVHNEPYAASTAQVLFANHLSGLHARFGFYSAQNIVKSYPLPFSWTERYVYRESEFAFPCSQTVLETLRHKGYTARATHLPLGIDPDLYRPYPEDNPVKAQLRERGTPVIGFLGRITKEKGLDTFFRALARLPEQTSWTMIVVGDGDYADNLRKQAKALNISNRVQWTGYVDHEEAPRYLSAFDLLVLPSETQPNWKEQFGRVLVESMACGTPVLGSDSGEIPHLIERTGGGLTFPEGDAAACACQLQRLLDDNELRTTLARRGRDSVYDRYTHAALAEDFIETIESL